MAQGSPIDYESQKIKKTVLSTTMAELDSLHDVLRFMSVSPWIVDGQIWRSCKPSHED